MPPIFLKNIELVVYIWYHNMIQCHYIKCITIDGGGNMQLWRERILYILKFIKKRKPNNLIDLGCGNGKVLEHINSCMPNIKICGVDKNENQCKKLRKKFKQENIVIINKDFTKNILELYESDIDMILLIEVIEHFNIHEVFILLRNICSKLQAKNILITTPNRDYNKNLKELTEDGLRNKDHKFEFTQEDIYVFIEKCETICGEYNIYQDYCDKKRASFCITFERKNNV